MEKRLTASFFTALILALGIFAGTAHADKSSVVLESVDQAAKGTEVRVIIHVAHSANNFLHHTNWLRVKINGEETQQWEYSSMDHLPPGAKFTKEIKLLIKEPTEVEAEASCNLHGSKGPAVKKIMLK